MADDAEHERLMRQQRRLHWTYGVAASHEALAAMDRAQQQSLSNAERLQQSFKLSMLLWPRAAGASACEGIDFHRYGVRAG